MPQISDIQTRIERAIFDNLLNQVVEKGYQVNFRDTIRYPQNPDGSFTEQAQANIKTDQEVIRQQKGFIIPIFNFGASEAKGLKTVPRIVIVPLGFIRGAVGGDTRPNYILKEGKYYAEVMPPQTSDYLVNIHAIAQTANQMRILNGLISLALPKRGWIISTYSQDKFFLINNNSPLMRELEQTIENVYQYTFPDLFEVEARVDESQTYSSLNEIDLTVDINNVQQNNTKIP